MSGRILGRTAGPQLDGWRRFAVSDVSVGGTLYVPPSGGDVLPLVVALHGCRQTAGDFAFGTRFAELADAEGFAVLFPESVRTDAAHPLNPRGCWIWWSAINQTRAGEPGLIAALLRRVYATEPRLKPIRACVTGLSSGAAMATILGAVYPDLVRAVAAHAGVAYSAAEVRTPTLPIWFSATPDARSALATFSPLNWYRLYRWSTEGLDVLETPDGLADLHAARILAHRAAVPVNPPGPVRVLVVHGDADQTVDALHARELIKQVLQVADLIDNDTDDDSVDTRADAIRDSVGGAGNYPVRTRDYHDAHGALVGRLVEIGQLGHAWSGGSPAGSYTDPLGPVATELTWRFFRDEAPAS